MIVSGSGKKECLCCLVLECGTIVVSDVGFFLTGFLDTAESVDELGLI